MKIFFTQNLEKVIKMISNEMLQKGQVQIFYAYLLHLPSEKQDYIRNLIDIDRWKRMDYKGIEKL